MHALRAVAIVMVLLYHLWPVHYRGGFIGVDVFLVLSGFLITGQIIRKMDHGWRLLPGFWARRVLRLAPAALTVVAGTALLTWCLVPPALWARYAKEAIASVAIFENMALFSDAVDYLAAENSPTPFQHYWSLSVEEQFYIVWPTLLILLGILFGLFLPRRRVAQFLAGSIGLVSLVSFVVALEVLSVNPSAAYFLMPLRVWEFGIGGLLAFWVPLITSWAPEVLWRNLARGVLVASYAGLIVYGWRLDSSLPFPGWYGLVAVLLTAAVIVAHPVARLGESNPLVMIERSRIVRFIADNSYAAYLWHWPLIVLAPFILQGQVTLPWKIAIVIATFGLAWATTAWIERPFRFATPRSRLSRRSALITLAGLTLLVLLAWAMMWASSDRRAAEEGAAGAEGPCFAAQALFDPESCGGSPHGEVPSLSAIAASETDRPDPWIKGCVAKTFGADLFRCDYLVGPEDGPAIVLWGDSHAGSWTPAFEGAAKELGVNLFAFVRDGCPPSLVSPTATVSRDIDEEEQANCRARNQQVLDFIDSHPNVVGVFAANFSTNYIFPEGAAHGDIAEMLAGVASEGRASVLVGDAPLTGPSVRERLNVPECLMEHQDDPAACDNPREVAQATSDQREAVARATRGEVEILETADGLCDDSTCYALIGGVPVFFDASHFTDTYSRSLGTWMAEKIEPHLQRVGVDSR